jgi:hypothetical protein
MKSRRLIDEFENAGIDYHSLYPDKNTAQSWGEIKANFDLSADMTDSEIEKLSIEVMIFAARHYGVMLMHHRLNIVMLNDRDALANAK